LLKRVYAKRAAIRGQEQTPVIPTWPECQDWPSDKENDESPSVAVRIDTKEESALGKMLGDAGRGLSGRCAAILG
jgi:hypothetical protein